MRDIKRLQEDLRLLGYKNELSVLAFVEPRFDIMSEILQFLVGTLDPRFIVSSPKSEKERIKFVKGVTIHVAVQTTLQLNTRLLFASEYSCIKEMLKLSRYLVSCLSAKKPENYSQLELSVKDFQKCQQYAEKITNIGAELFQILDDEVGVRVQYVFKTRLAGKKFYLNPLIPKQYISQSKP
jgi:hypothetical protein